jgi:hypothetical protein
MNINYEIRETDEFGKGIFALEDIPIGTLIWTYQLNKNVFEYNEEQSKSYLSTLPDLSSQQSFLNFSFGKGEVLCLITDDGQYMNHADTDHCNCKTDLLTGHCFAKRNIKRDEQLFEDYSVYSHPSFLYNLLKQYTCEPDYYVLPSTLENSR